MTKATHNGTCQVCGNLQANNLGLAKHGYTVTYNYFQGTCRGSERSPLELSKDLALQTIDNCIAEASRLESLTINDVKKVPVTFQENRKLITVIKTREEYAAFSKIGKPTFERAQENVIFSFRREAKFLLEHAQMLTARIAAVHGQPLQSREDTTQRIKEMFDKMPDAYARAEELKLEGWKARVSRRNHETQTTLTATK